MDYNLFIIPITLIVVELIKRAELVNTKYLPILAVCFGAIAGLQHLYQRLNRFQRKAGKRGIDSPDALNGSMSPPCWHRLTGRNIGFNLL